MIIKRLLLNNIRSYTNQEVNFPEGSVLLSGNIGSGKSTVLLAIDFALFGLRRSELSGSALLRNGEDRGFVELNFKLDNKEVTVHRSLKRSSTSVTQDAGWISVNGDKREGTAIELKQKILELLNYPKELLTKSKHMVYQYTVYTPQESMKQILTGDKEARLDTLRKVFGIDKYKRIGENAKVVISKIKEKRKEFEGMIANLPQKEQEREDRLQEFELIQKEVQSIEPSLKLAEDNVILLKSQIQDLETQIKELKDMKNESDLIAVTVRHKEEKRNDSLLKLKSLKEELQKLSEENLEVKDFSEFIEEKRKLLMEKENLFKERGNKLQELKTLINSSEVLKNKLSQLDNCPTCYQAVTSEHKNKVLTEENKKTAQFSEQVIIVENDIKLLQQELTKINEELESLRTQQQKSEVIKLKKLNFDNKARERDNLIESINLAGKELEELLAKQKLLIEKTVSLKSIEENYNPLMEKLESANKFQRELEIKKAEVNTKLSSINNILDNLHKEIEEKLKTKGQLSYIMQLQQWLQEHFISLMSTMEKNIMLKVHSDFNSLFENWFNILIDSEVLNMTLDDEFSPLIEQNGYNVDYEHLSGGEKTAAALAYRLALNQVINNLMSSLKTSGLIILDEPTDGFSAEQLDRMKLLLEELDLPQILIVSHEQKIETFVNNIIKFEKKEHVSSVV